MKKLIQLIPIPFAGVMLALAVAGNLLTSFNPVYKNLFGLLSFTCFILLTLMIFLDFQKIKKALNHPVLSSVMPTYSMGIIVLSTYIIPFNRSIAYSFWIIGIVLHFILLLLFTKNHILNFKIEKVFASYFIVYVGHVCASVTAPAYNMQGLGKLLFYFGLISYLILLPIILYRALKIKKIPVPALPTVTIFAAPASLLLAGYMSSFAEKNILLTNLLLFASVASIICVLAYMPKMLKNGFFPSYSAFTFPIVISAIAALKTNQFYLSNNVNLTIFKIYGESLRYLAIFITIFVLFNYLNFITNELSLSNNEESNLQTN